MCLLCIATAAQIAAGATSAGAITAVVVKKFLTKIGANNVSLTKIIRRIDHEQNRLTGHPVANRGAT